MAHQLSLLDWNCYGSDYKNGTWHESNVCDVNGTSCDRIVFTDDMSTTVSQVSRQCIPLSLSLSTSLSVFYCPYMYVCLCLSVFLFSTSLHLSVCLCYSLCLSSCLSVVCLCLSLPVCLFSLSVSLSCFCCCCVDNASKGPIFYADNKALNLVRIRSLSRTSFRNNVCFLAIAVDRVFFLQKKKKKKKKMICFSFPHNYVVGTHYNTSNKYTQHILWKNKKLIYLDNPLI